MSLPTHFETYSLELMSVGEMTGDPRKRLALSWQDFPTTSIILLGEPSLGTAGWFIVAGGYEYRIESSGP